jgi:hypothetical protein
MAFEGTVWRGFLEYKELIFSSLRFFGKASRMTRRALPVATGWE